MEIILIILFSCFTISALFFCTKIILKANDSPKAFKDEDGKIVVRFNPHNRKDMLRAHEQGITLLKKTEKAFSSRNL
jgi:hypothetical protein